MVDCWNDVIQQSNINPNKQVQSTLWETVRTKTDDQSFAIWSFNEGFLAHDIG